MTVIGWKPVEEYNPNAYLVALNAKSNPISNIANTLSGLGDLGIQYADRAKNTLEFQTKLAEQAQKQLVERQNLMGQEFLADHPLFVQSLVDQASSGKAEDLAAARQRIAQLDAPTFIRDHLEKRIDKTYTDTLKNQETIAGIGQKNALTTYYTEQSKWLGPKAEADINESKQRVIASQGAEKRANVAANDAHQAALDTHEQSLTNEERNKLKLQEEQDLQAVNAAQNESERAKAKLALKTTRDQIKQLDRGDLVRSLRNDPFFRGLSKEIQSGSLTPQEGYQKFVQMYGSKHSELINNDQELLDAIASGQIQNKQEEQFYETAKSDVTKRRDELTKQMSEHWPGNVPYKLYTNPDADPVVSAVESQTTGLKDETKRTTISEEVTRRIQEIEQDKGVQFNRKDKAILAHALLSTAQNRANRGAFNAYLFTDTALDKSIFNNDAAYQIYLKNKEHSNKYDTYIETVHGPTGLLSLADRVNNLAIQGVRNGDFATFSQAQRYYKNQFWNEFENGKHLSGKLLQQAKKEWDTVFGTGVPSRVPVYGILDESGPPSKTEKDAKLVEQVNKGERPISGLSNTQIKDASKVIQNDETKTPEQKVRELQRLDENYYANVVEDRNNGLAQGLKDWLDMDEPTNDVEEEKFKRLRSLLVAGFLRKSKWRAYPTPVANERVQQQIDLQGKNMIIDVYLKPKLETIEKDLKQIEKTHSHQRSLSDDTKYYKLTTQKKKLETLRYLIRNQ